MAVWRSDTSCTVTPTTTRPTVQSTASLETLTVVDITPVIQRQATSSAVQVRRFIAYFRDTSLHDGVYSNCWHFSLRRLDGNRLCSKNTCNIISAITPPNFKPIWCSYVSTIIFWNRLYKVKGKCTVGRLREACGQNVLSKTKRYLQESILTNQNLITGRMPYSYSDFKQMHCEEKELLLEESRFISLW